MFRCYLVRIFAELVKAIETSWPRPKMLVLNFPANPTAMCVELNFFEKLVEIAKEHNIWVIQDIAYADIVFDGYVAPSILQVRGANDIAVEFSHSRLQYAGMACWLCC